MTLRPQTEWVETIETGANLLVPDRTAEAILKAAYQETAPRYEESPYGDGNASKIIIDILQSKYYS